MIIPPRTTDGRIFLVLPVVGWALAACPTTPTSFESRIYACSTSNQCSEGHRCLGGVCVPAVTGGGSGGSGGSSVAGARGGGGPLGGGQVGPCDVPEVCGDLVDDNCNGILDDGCECDAGRPCYPNARGEFFPDGLTSPSLHYPWDGGAGCSPGAQECVEGRLSQTCANLRVPQQEYCDGRDNDCDGVIDLGCPCQTGRPCYTGAPFTNGVGACQSGVWSCALPLEDRCVNMNVGSAEVCDGVDNDCNGLVDDNPLQVVCGPGVCSSVERVCRVGVDQTCDLNAIDGYSPTENCLDSWDNDCDGVVNDGCACTPESSQDCFTGPTSACPVDAGPCKGVCRRGRQTCLDGGATWSACQGEKLPTTEACSDGLDNDCNGATDCGDTNCAARPCSLDGGVSNGRSCFRGQCQCVRDGGVGATESCANGVDDDCDGLIDCAQASCNLKACGNNGKTCASESCTCVPRDGGVAQQAETLCADGLDNDCDGLTDCGDTTCAGLDCGRGRTCQKNICSCLGSDAGTPQVNESLCYDGRDNDCDGLTDGVDPDCLHQRCSATSASRVWCSTATGGCKDLSGDELNCGLCGVECGPGFTCSSAGSSSGQCTCSSDSDCPLSQACNSSKCDCDDRDSRCGDRKCREISGADYCTY